MKIAGIQFPEPLLAAMRDRKLVVFAGAGVSMGKPANLPSFTRLAHLIATGTGEAMQDMEPEDRFLGRLKHRQVDVHTRAAQELSRGDPGPTGLHHNLLRLYSEAAQVRVVTTNFDLLFEQAAKDEFGVMPEVFRAPALPLGRSFTGIVHLHGVVSRPEEMVLTDADFGRAYLTEGWARRFLIDLFRHFTVLFVGYSHNDTIVSYLARALPESETGQRFALTEEDDSPQRWQVLGIEPIGYPKPSKHDYSALYEGVRRLADTVRRSVLDWQREVTELATKPPPLSDEEADIIEDALKNAPTTRFFTNAARLPEWISWLDKRKHLEPLFAESDLSERDTILAWWLAEHYAVRCADDLFLLIAKHGIRLHPQFWWALGREIAFGKSGSLDDKTLSRWISVLLATLSAIADQHVLLWLGERCVKQEAVANLLEVFGAMAGSRVILKPGFSWPDDNGENPSSRIEVDLPLLGDHYALNELWEKGLKPRLDQVAEPLLGRVVRRLEEQHLTLCSWHKASREGDGTSWRRSAIEPHEQDQYPEAVDVLIDSARDCLEWLASNQAQAAARWCDQLAGSDTPLLRRLSVHALSARADLMADDKLDWLLAHIGLHDTPAHHEIFRAVKLAYPKASPGRRSALIEAVQAYRWPDEDDQDKERRTTRHYFDWLHWLHSAAPDCALTKQALDEVLAKYPEFKPREHPDLTHWMGSGWVGPQSPWTPEQLLTKPAADWLPELLAFQPTEFLGPDRDGLVFILAEAAKREVDWGLELADALAGAGKWDSDLWSGLMRAWSEMELDENRYHEVLRRLGRVELYPGHARAIADALYALVKNDGKPYAFNLLSQANEIAAALWCHLDRAEVPEERDDWLQLAINHPAGILAEFWLGSLSLWRRQQDPMPKVLNDEYRRALSDVIQDPMLPGRLGRPVLASQFAFLLAADEAWTRENLLPLFDPNNGVLDFQAAWDGFLAWGRLNPAVAELLERPFLEAVQRIESDLSRRCDRFVKYYTAMLGYFAADPLTIWIPKLFRHGSVDARRLFASDVKHHLRSMSEAQQREWWQRWLKAYWENRLQGVPAVLEPGEIERMLGWLPHLGVLFPEAVNIAIQMPQASLQHSSVVYELRESELLRRHPEAVARLLIYLGESDSPSYIWHEGRKLIDKLLESRLPSILENGLKELIAKLGLT